MEQDDYVAGAAFDERTLSSLLAELEYQRRATLCFFGSLGTEELARLGTANDTRVSVRALAFIIAGPQDHHLRILRERYLARKD